MKKVKILFSVLLLIVVIGSVRYALLPKVETRMPVSGSMRFLFSPESIQVESIKTFALYVPLELSHELSIENWFINPWEYISIGSRLFKVQSGSGERVLLEAKQQEKQQLLNLKQYEYDYATLQKQLTEQLDKAQQQYEHRKSQQNENELKRVQENYRLVVEDGVWQNTTIELEREKVELLHKEVVFLEGLKQNEWNYISDYQGYVCNDEWLKKTAICGGDTLLLLYPAEEDTILRLTAYFPQEQLSGYTKISYSFDGNKQYGTLLSYENGIIVSCFPDFPLDQLNTNLTFELESEWKSCLIPSISLMNDSTVFVVEERKGLLWPEKIIRKTEVKIGLKQSDWVSIESGLRKEDRIVIFTDRGLSDGQNVWEKKDSRQ